MNRPIGKIKFKIGKKIKNQNPVLRIIGGTDTAFATRAAAWLMRLGFTIASPKMYHFTFRKRNRDRKGMTRQRFP